MHDYAGVIPEDAGGVQLNFVGLPVEPGSTHEITVIRSSVPSPPVSVTFAACP